MKFFMAIYLLSLLMLMLANVLAVLALSSLCRQSASKSRTKLQNSAAMNLVRTRSQSEDCDILLGNSLSCLIIQIDVAKKFNAKSPEVALNALDEAESLAAESLVYLRQRRQTKEVKESLVYSPGFAGGMDFSASAGN